MFYLTMESLTFKHQEVGARFMYICILKSNTYKRGSLNTTANVKVLDTRIDCIPE